MRILIWERGVGPTEASGTGACAAAVAAARYGGAARDVEVVAPGGTQRVEWTDDGLFLTGWAEVVAEVTWCDGRRAMMRKLHEAVGSIETYSPAEELFNRRRRTVGLFLAPVVLLGAAGRAAAASPAPAHRLAAILALMVVLWITEALPLAVTALLGPSLAVVLGVAPARAAFAPFADPIIFLFIGSFILAEAMFVHGLDRRIAFTALSSRLVGASAVAHPRRLRRRRDAASRCGSATPRRPR